jgi:hypothetical protein
MSDGIAGVCNVCKQLVSEFDFRNNGHGCPNYYVDYSPETIANPHNEPWLPGYRFFLRQASQKVRGGNVHMRTREYAVHFRIGVDGVLRWTGGIKATHATQERAEALYAANRPGSNWYPGADQEEIR